VINIGSRTGHKIGILLILTTLTIGSVAGLSWESPKDGDDFKDTITLNVSAPDSSSITFYYDDGSVTEIGSDSSSGEFYSTDWDSSNAGTGNFDLIAGNGSQNDTISVTADFAKPNVDSFSPSEDDFTNEDSLEVSYSASDEHTSVDSEYIRVEDSDGDQVNDADSDNVDVDDLSNGETYTVEYEVRDSVGNWNNDSWDFTVDTEYDGDSNPSFSVEDESGGVVLFDEDKDLTVDFGDADSTSDTTVTCYVGGEDVGDFTVDANEDNPDESDTTCSIDDDDNEDYYDTSAEIYLEMQDEAGNTEESDSETVAFDVNAPSVTGLEIPTDADLYNADFDVEFSAYDSASDIEEVEYYFESDTDYGEGTEIDYSSDTESYEIDTSSLSAGDHTLYVRAQDEADRWSSARSVDFTFDPEAVPEISVDVPESVSVTAGQRKSFEVTIENTGDLFISNIELSGSAEGVFSDTESISDLEPGDSITASLRVDTESGNIGEHTIQVSTDNPSMNEEISLVVEANSDQRSRIDSDISEYQTMLQEMEANVTDLQQKVSESKKERLNSNFSSFKQKVEDAQSAIDSGDYYEAEAILEGVDEDYSAAESTYEAVEKEYKNNQFWMLILLGLGGFIVLGGGAIGALSYTDEFEFDVRDYLDNLQEMEFDTGFVDRYVEKIKRMMEGKDTSEAEEFEWEGFKNN
jgi:hypothetical protein